MRKFSILLAASIGLSAVQARAADVITAVTSQSALGANDSVTYDQLGGDGTVFSTASVVSANGASVGLGVSSGGSATVCQNTGYNCYPSTQNTGLALGNGSGAIGSFTVTLTGAQGIGTYVGSNAA